MSGGGGALRIAQVAPVAAPVAPGGGESVEQLVSELTDSLVRRGHDVTLYATGDSRTSARLRSERPSGYDFNDDIWDWFRAESFHAAFAFEHAAEHDLIHAHDFNFALPFAAMTGTPLIDTPHTEISPEVREAYRRHPDVHVVAVSHYQREMLGELRNVTVIPHGIRFDGFPQGDGSGGYLLFLGRMIADKGPAEAVRIAEAAAMPLILAGPPQDGYDIREHAEVDGERVRWVGAVGHTERNRLLAGAVALVFPLLYPEPFGLVLLEAMACGTPALATQLGAAPELIDPGVTGYTAPTWEELADLVPAVAKLDRAAVRARAAARFDVERMVDAHESLYRRVARQPG